MKPTKAHLLQQEELVRRMVNAWDPVGLLACGAPEDEYDCIVQRVLSDLHNGKAPQVLSEDLTTFIAGHFGSAVPIGGVDSFAVMVTEAWREQQGTITA
jgi:hypothetical protein